MKAQKKKPKISAKAGVRKKAKGGRSWAPIRIVAVGADISLSTISMAGIAETKDGKIRVGTSSIRWESGVDYYDRLRDAARCMDNVVDALFKDMKIMPELVQVHFAIEEAVPIGMLQRQSKGQKTGMAGAFISQQIQISGAFLGGLLKWGYTNVGEIQSNQWRALVAHDLGITTYYKKWSPPELAKDFHCQPINVGKFRAKQWVKKFHPEWDKDWPDIIKHGKRGYIPRPLDSYAQGVQSDDRYEALAMAEFLWRQLAEDN